MSTAPEKEVKQIEVIDRRMRDALKRRMNFKFVDHFQLENTRKFTAANTLLYSLPCQLSSIANIPHTCWHYWLCRLYWLSCSKLVQPAVPPTSSTTRRSLSVCQRRVNRDICVVIIALAPPPAPAPASNFNSICSVQLQLHLHLRLCLCRLFLSLVFVSLFG